ncbi:6144_t:CDS:2 [Cetraspora pellucida]|uniref:6144_t:CDS:1 n=1 Tax=Cetraspora pellucida TaxID=1433469 RepID=A0ACA9K9E2_9GLOM|nr:6144_t:CDS:2 [Cetraspora pellucida]
MNIFGQLPHCDTNLINILEDEESSDNYTLISENSQSTISSEISNETVESELDEKYFEESQEFNNDIQQVEDNYNDVDEYEIQEINNANEIQKANSYLEKIQDHDYDILQEFYDDFTLSLYDSEIGECSKNTLASKIIEIIDSDDDTSKDQHYTSLEKEKWRSQTILNIKRNWEVIRSRMEEKYKVKRKRKFELGEFVKICIPDLDKNKMGQRSLPCKVLQKKHNIDSYQVACQYGILENWYLASEIEPLETLDYPSLNHLKAIAQIVAVAKKQTVHLMLVPVEEVTYYVHDDVDVFYVMNVKIDKNFS